MYMEWGLFRWRAGNKDTLLRQPKKSGVDVRKQLLGLHSRYYSANIAKLAVMGSGTYANRPALQSDKLWGAHRIGHVACI
jgi:secreted Zn-dependent insulinase-like peptidase